MPSGFWPSSHSYARCLYHVVFVPKYRRSILRGDVVGRINTLLYQAAKTNKWFIHELEAMPDHIHLLIQIPATTTIAKAMFYLKGGTSKVIRSEFPELEEFLWGDGLWRDGYFAETVGRQNEKAMREYIRNQWEQEPGTSPGLQPGED